MTHMVACAKRAKSRMEKIAAYFKGQKTRWGVLQNRTFLIFCMEGFEDCPNLGSYTAVATMRNNPSVGLSRQLPLHKGA